MGDLGLFMWGFCGSHIVYIRKPRPPTRPLVVIQKPRPPDAPIGTHHKAPPLMTRPLVAIVY